MFYTILLGKVLEEAAEGGGQCFVFIKQNKTLGLLAKEGQ